MSDHKGQGDQHTTPDDVATLYSWANLHGAKYRDFSASRAQIRETARLRVQEATEAERQQVSAPIQAAMTAETQRAAEAERAAAAQRQAEWEAQQSAQHTAQLAAQLASQQAAQEAAQQAAVEAAARAAQHRAAMETAQLAAHAAEQRAAQEAAQRAAEAAQHQAAQEAAQLAFEAAEQRAANEAAQRAAEEAEHRAAQQAARLATEAAEQRAAKFSAELAALKAAHEAAQKAAQKAADEVAQHTAQQPVWQPPSAERIASIPASSAVSPAAPYEPPAPQPPFQRFDFPGYERPPQGYVSPVQAFSGAPAQPPAPPSQNPVLPQQEAAPEGSVAQPRYPWPPTDSRENAGRPAWLMPGRAETPVQTPQTPASAPHPAPDTLQGSRDRLASRWFALRGVFEGGHAPVEAAPAPAASRAPVMAVFSLAGGVGKTSLVATLGRSLAARGERVLLVDTAAFGLLPFFFGARDQRPGLLRTFSPPGVSNDAPIQMVTIDPESLGPEPAGADAGVLNGLSGEISRYARGGVSRVIVDLATASGAVTRKLIRMAPMILVPVIPDMNSVVSVTSIDDFFEHNSLAGSKVPLYYVMNQFDPSLPLHLDIREVLRQQLGDRLLPFALRRTPAVSEALAEGMTVMDYAPNSTVAEDFATLAGWVKSLSAPASTTYRGVRWSER
jgi:cellulose synthase operon protein YhjQ